MLPFDGYIRVSQVAGRSGPSFISPDVQREQITAWAAGRGAEIAMWHEDLDQMGSLTSRPGYDLAMERALSGQTAGIVVAKLDRWFRSLAPGLEAIARLLKEGREFVAVREGIDPTTPTGMLQLQLMLAFHEFERAQVGSNWQIARERAIARGVYVASTVPYGYVRGEDGVLEVDPDAAAIVVEAFKMKAAGKSPTEILEHVEGLGVRSSAHGFPFSNGWIRPLLRNRAYLGEARHGEFVNHQAHPPIIDKALFVDAQRAVGSPAPAQSVMPALLLIGVARCAGCQYTLKAGTVRKDGRVYRTYHCRRRHTAGPCEAPATIMDHKLDRAFETAFFEMVRGLRADASLDAGETQDLQRELAAAELELEMYRDDSRILTALGADRFVDGLEVRAAEVSRVEQDLARVRASQPVLGLPADVSIEDAWSMFDIEAKRRLVKSCIGAIFLSRGPGAVADRMTVLPLGSEPADLPHRGSRAAFVPRPFVPAG